MSSRARTITGAILAALGVLVLLIEIGVHLYAAIKGKPELELNHGVIMVGMVLGFVGFFSIDPHGAEEGGGFLVTSATRLIAVVRTGRRSTDVAAIVDDDPKAPS